MVGLDCEVVVAGSRIRTWSCSMQCWAGWNWQTILVFYWEPHYDFLWPFCVTSQDYSLNSWHYLDPSSNKFLPQKIVIYWGFRKCAGIPQEFETKSSGKRDTIKWLSGIYSVCKELGKHLTSWWMCLMGVIPSSSLSSCNPRLFDISCWTLFCSSTHMFQKVTLPLTMPISFVVLSLLQLIIWLIPSRIYLLDDVLLSVGIQNATHD